MIRKILITFFCLAGLTSTAQPRFYRTFSAPGISLGYELKAIATADGGWITGGDASNKIVIFKYDKCGILEWCRLYTGSEDLNALDIVVSRSGGCAITGYAGPYPYNCDPFLLRIDAAGNVKYCKKYAASSQEHTYSVGEDARGNFFINGNTNYGGTDMGNNFIIKTDSLGNLSWSKLYSLGGYWALAMVCSDGGVLRCGGWGDFYKVDSAGALSWVKYGFYQGRYEPEEVSDGYIFPSYPGARAFLLKTDLNGNTLWSSVQYAAWGSFQRLSSKPGGNVIAENGNIVTEFDVAGRLVRQNQLKSSTGGYPNMTDICRLQDGSYIVSGFQSVSLFNARLDSLLHTGCADLDLPVDTIAPPLLNIRDTMYTPVDKVFTPENLTVSFVDLVSAETLDCSTADSLDFTISAPAASCSGETFTMSVSSASSGGDWTWYTGGCGASYAGAGASLTVAPAAGTTYYLEAKACDTTACVPVNVNILETPHASFYSGLQASCSDAEIMLTNTSSGASSYTWSFSDGYSSTDVNVAHPLEKDHPFTISLVAGNGLCSDTTVLSSYLSWQSLLGLMVPNVFTPNGDGANDNFRITLNPLFSGCFHIKIYDRWGLLMHESEDPSAGWDGRTQGGQAAGPGTYFYSLEAGGREYKGQITLLE
jgi:gliding motility-associated-like protein